MFLTERDDENEHDEHSNQDDTKLKKPEEINENEDQLSHNLS